MVWCSIIKISQVQVICSFDGRQKLLTGNACSIPEQCVTAFEKMFETHRIELLVTGFAGGDEWVEWQKGTAVADKSRLRLVSKVRSVSRASTVAVSEPELW